MTQRIDNQVRLWGFLFVARALVETFFYFRFVTRMIGVENVLVAGPLFASALLAIFFRTRAMFVVYGAALLLTAIPNVAISGTFGLLTILDVMVGLLLFYLYTRFVGGESDRRTERLFPLLAAGAGGLGLVLVGVGAVLDPASVVGLSGMQLGIMGVGLGAAAVVERHPQAMPAAIGLGTGAFAFVLWAVFRIVI